MKKIYLILITLTLFTCSSDDDCSNHTSADVYNDEFSYFEDKQLKITNVAILNELGEIISEELYNGTACSHGTLFVFKKNRNFQRLINGGAINEPKGCYLIDTDSWDNYNSTWTPELRIKTKEDCSTENVLKISTSYSHEDDPLHTFKQYTVTINGNSLIFDRIYVVSGEKLTERTFYVIN
jgi:hypothetical protein